MYKITEHEGQRYVGDTSTMTVHDTWSSDCENCVIVDLIERGVAVAFNPDNLDHAFMNDFDYCDYCFGRQEPKPPDDRSSTQLSAE